MRGRVQVAQRRMRCWRLYYRSKYSASARSLDRRVIEMWAGPRDVDPTQNLRVRA